MLRTIIGKRQRHRISGGHCVLLRCRFAAIALAAETLALAEQPHQRLDVAAVEIGKNLGEIQSPLRARHGAERAAALGGKLDDLHAPVAARALARDQTFRHQPVDQAGDIAVRHHHALRQFAERHAGRRLVELGEHVEARQRGIELLAQPAADLALDHGRCR